MNDSHPPDAASALAARIAQFVPDGYLSSPEALVEVSCRLLERQRHWHGPGHILTLLSKAAAAPEGENRDALLLAAVYHDAIYDPRAADNEDASAALLTRHAKNPDAPVIRRALELIHDSKWTRMPSTASGRSFFEWDTQQLSDDCSLAERLAYERAIFREYQWVPWSQYRIKRAEFLRSWAQRFPHQKRGTEECSELLAALQPRIAVYPGSFQPFHLGHWSILRRAEQTFDKVIVALGVNRQKLTSADSLQSRQAALQAQLPFHETVAFDGLLSVFLDGLDVETTVVRGVRDGTDLEAELRYARFLDDLRPTTGVVWISCEAQFQHLSSSAIRELGAIQAGAENRYVPTAAQIYGWDRLTPPSGEAPVPSR